MSAEDSGRYNAWEQEIIFGKCSRKNTGDNPFPSQRLKSEMPNRRTNRSCEGVSTIGMKRIASGPAAGGGEARPSRGLAIACPKNSSLGKLDGLKPSSLDWKEEHSLGVLLGGEGECRPTGRFLIRLHRLRRQAGAEFRGVFRLRPQRCGPTGSASSRRAMASLTGSWFRMASAA